MAFNIRVWGTGRDFKSTLGDRLHPRGLAAQGLEANLACKILNRLRVLGRPR